MENIQKVLILAGTILITILLISLGIYVYKKNTMSSSENTQSLVRSMETQVYNQKYELYKGVQNGKRVKELLKLVSKNNQDKYLDSSQIKYCIFIRTKIPEILRKCENVYEMENALNGTRAYGVMHPQNIDKISDYLSRFKKYNIYFSYNEDGYIYEVNIEDTNSN